MIERDWQSVFVTPIRMYRITKYNSYFYRSCITQLKVTYLKTLIATLDDIRRKLCWAHIKLVELVVDFKWVVKEGWTDISRV